MYLQPLLMYWWILAPVTLVGGLAGLIYANMVEPRYRASCRFEIFENKMLIIGNQQQFMHETPFSMYNTNPIERHIVLLTSRNLDGRIRKRLAGNWGTGDTAPGVVLVVKPVEKASSVMVDIMVDSSTEKYSVAYIESLLQEYQTLRREEISLIHDDTVQNLRKEQSVLAAQLEEARNAVIKFEVKHNVLFEEKRSESDMAHMANVLRKGRAIREQRKALEGQLEPLKNANAATLRDALDLTVFSTAVLVDERGREIGTPAWSNVSSWAQAEVELARLRDEYEAKKAVFKTGHPRMLEITRKIDAAEREQRIAADLTMKRLRSRLDALRLQEEALEKAAQEIEAAADLTTEERAQYEMLKANEAPCKTLHERVFNRINESTSQPQDRYFSRVVEGPFSLSAAVWPVKWRMVATGMAGAGGAAAALIILVFLSRLRLYGLTNVEESLGLQALGSIPRVVDPELQEDPRSLNKLHKAAPICEAYRIIRTHIEENIGHGKIVLITSPDESEGKSFTCAHTAIASTWTKERVLLIDGDFRKPSQGKMFGLSDVDIGFADCLGDASLNWRDFVQKDVVPKLDLLPAGRAKGHGAELLQTGPVDAILSELSEDYDLIVIDSAPVNRVVDTMLLSKLADAVVLVAYPGRTSVPSIYQAVRRLSGARIIGYVANRVAQGNQRYYSEYGSYGYYQRRNYYYGQNSKS
jgi:capsular exopolysaccharide synthesis family protein